MSSDLSSKSLTEIWNEYDDMERQLAAPLSQRMIELAQLQPGMHVLDLATGRGEPAIPAAIAVGNQGLVVGIDIAESMLAMARQRADREGITNLTLHPCDAESLEGIPLHSYDRVLARWCLMYFQRPIAALCAAHRLMKKHAKIVVAVWAEPERVDYYTFPRKVLRQLCDLEDKDLYAPGIFAYSDLQRIHRDFNVAGFEVTSVEEIYVHVMRVATVNQLIQWTRIFGLNRLLKNVSVEIQSTWESEMARQAEALQCNGEYRLGGVTRVVVAERSQ